MPNNFFTNENPKDAHNDSHSYGIISSSINPSFINDGLTERGAGLGKIGTSMPSPMARLFLFSAALREVNNLEGKKAGTGHVGIINNDGNFEATPYHELVGEMLDMLEFIFKYGDEPDFHVQTWNVQTDCQALDKSQKAHKELSSALKSAFDFGILQQQPIIYLFLWKNHVIGGTSPISLVYTSANLRSLLGNELPKFTGDEGNILFNGECLPLHKRSAAFREYLYRLRYTDLVGKESFNALSKYIQDSGSTYDKDIENEVKKSPENYSNVKDLTSQGAKVRVLGVQSRMSDHTIVINPSTTDYLLKSSRQTSETPLILTKNGEDNLIYANGRKWNPGSDIIDATLSKNISERHLPGFGNKAMYPFLTITDFFEDKVIEVSYGIDRKKFYTGSKANENEKKNLTFLLPLKKVFFEYFSINDLIEDNGHYTDMLKVEYDEERSSLTFDLYLPLINGHTICLHKKYDTSMDSKEKLNCYDGSNTFNFAVFPFYRLEPDTSHNVYNIMIGNTVNDVTVNFYEGANKEVNSISKQRTIKSGEKYQLNTKHIRVKEAFTFMEINVSDGRENATALIIPIFKKVNSDSTRSTNDFKFGIDFGTTNTHVSYVQGKKDKPFGRDQVKVFQYKEEDSQMVVLNDKNGPCEFGAFTTAVKRELVPFILGETIKFPMRTATYQVAGNPNVLEMFFNTNIGFNYGEDISGSDDYKTNIKWDRFDGNANDRMATFFTQMLWMMKNKSVLNDGSDSFTIVVTYPISMRPNDLNNFKTAWDNAIKDVQCNVKISYRTESVAPYYSYLVDLQYGTPYINMDIGGGTTDILYVDPFSKESLVFSAFFAANDLWNDGVDKVNRTSKANGFVKLYKTEKMLHLEDKTSVVEKVINNATSSADIISYLFTNDQWTRLSNTIRNSRRMMQLPIIHFSALVFYTAYALHVKEVGVPRNLSFTGMGSKYIKLISSADSDISNLVNAIFHYAGKVLNNSSLKESDISISFSDSPKEVTAIGALVSLNYSKPINPSEETIFGYEEEDPGKTMRYKDINSDIRDSVIRLFKKFVELFRDDDVQNILSNIGYSIDSNIIDKLNRYAESSLLQMKDNSEEGQQPTDKLREPMFFWPLKNSLYLIGKDISSSEATPSQNN